MNPRIPTDPETKPTTAFESQHWLSDEAIAAHFPNLPATDVELVRRFVFQQGFGIESWYTQLAEHTFETEFITLSDDEVRAIVRLSDFSTLDSEFGAPTPEDEVALENLATRLDKCIKQWGEDGAFVKLDTRSPKDAVVDRTKDEAHVERVMSLVEQELHQQHNKAARTIPSGSAQEPNSESESNKNDAASIDGKFSDSEVLAAFMRATTRAMHIQTGKEAIHDLFLHSRRAYEDLRRVLRFSQHEVKHDGEKSLCATSIAVRRWHNAVGAGPEGEFRGFVYDGKLQALTAYDNLIGYTSIIKNREQIEETIRSFYANVLNDQLPGHRDGCVVDFFVDKDRVFLIEINPFSSGTGPSLFSWKHDRERLMNGPFEFRVLNESVQDTLKTGMIPFWWRKMERYIAKPYLNKTADASDANHAKAQQATTSQKGLFGAKKIASGISDAIKRAGERIQANKKK